MQKRFGDRQKLDVVGLARVIGHRNLSILLLYCNASADEMADRLHVPRFEFAVSDSFPFFKLIKAIDLALWKRPFTFLCTPAILK